MYTWQDKKTEKKVDVLRSFADYEVPPTEEEAPGLEDPEWVRQIGSQINLVRGPGWNGGKGFWTVLLVSYLCLQLPNWLC